MQDATEMTTSIHHRVQVRITNGWPQSGTQTKAVILTIVASPIGKVPYLWVSNRSLSRKGVFNYQEHRLNGMAQHCTPDSFKHCVSKDRDDHEGDEQDHVETIDDH
jgi:hypothetical protein